MENTITESPIINQIKNSGSNKAREYKGDKLGKDDFLKLLVTQLRYQDPTQPMDNKEFIAQTAQFSSLEQMTNMNKTMESMNKSYRSGEAYSLLGKNIQGYDPLTKVKVEGTVTGLFYKGDEIRLVVGNRDIGLNNISAVYIESKGTNNRGNN